MIAAIIQARMGSTRLPGKVMKEVCGKPLLWHLIQRLKTSQTIDKIIIATTVNAADKPILELARQMGIDSFAGSEEDVLDRYYRAAEKHKADIVVRITADCPLIDPALMDKVITHYIENKDDFDYVQSGISYPDGIVETSVLPFSILEKTWREAKLPSEREHVTSYIWKNPSLFRVYIMENDEDLSDIRLTVDDETDFKLAAEVFKNLYKEGEVFSMQDILDFLETKPELLELNKGTIRNAGYIKSLIQDGDIS